VARAQRIATARVRGGVVTRVDKDALVSLARMAWDVRARSRILGSTAVGCAVVGASGGTWVGCNVEHKFRSHDIHAETNAISSMVAGGEQQLEAIVAVAERDRFTPCGACLDWVWEFGGADCIVGVQNAVDGPMEVFRAWELMPHYPR
jgi:cytidine deaminase